MDVQMGYDQLRLTPGAWLDLLGGVWTYTQYRAFPRACLDSGQTDVASFHLSVQQHVDQAPASYVFAQILHRNCFSQFGIV